MEEEKLSKDMGEAEAQLEIGTLQTETDIMAFVEGDDREDVVTEANERIAELAEASAPLTESDEEPEGETTTPPKGDKLAPMAQDSTPPAPPVRPVVKPVGTGIRQLLDACPKVRVRISKTEKDQEDVFFAIGGESILIKRGEWVEIPDAFYEVLKASEYTLYTQVDREGKQTGKQLVKSKVSRFPHEAVRESKG